jgi:predicted DNA-binding ribbon-helix-helix protein
MMDPSPVRKRSVEVGGKHTSVSLEEDVNTEPL